MGLPLMWDFWLLGPSGAGLATQCVIDGKLCQSESGFAPSQHVIGGQLWLAEGLGGGTRHCLTHTKPRLPLLAETDTASEVSQDIDLIQVWQLVHIRKVALPVGTKLHAGTCVQCPFCSEDIGHWASGGRAPACILLAMTHRNTTLEKHTDHILPSHVKKLKKVMKIIERQLLFPKIFMETS